MTARPVCVGRPDLTGPAAPRAGTAQADAPPAPVLQAIRTGQSSSGIDGAMVCLPLATAGRHLGALALTFAEARELDEAERAFLMLVARTSSQALERVRLLEDERASRARAELLYRLADAVIGAGRVEQVFEAALQAIAPALGTDRAAVLVYDADDVMRFRAWRGLSDAYRSAVEGHTPWKRDARDPQPVLVADVAQDESLSDYLALFQREEIGALGFIPLVSGGRLLGKFMVYYDRPRTLTATELDLAPRHRQPRGGRRGAIRGRRRAETDGPVQRSVHRHSGARPAQSAGGHHHVGAPGDGARHRATDCASRWRAS